MYTCTTCSSSSNKLPSPPRLHRPKWELHVAVEGSALPDAFLQTAVPQERCAKDWFVGKAKHTFGAVGDGPSIHLELHEGERHREGDPRGDAPRELCVGWKVLG